MIGASAYSSAIFGVSSANGPDPGPFPGFIAGVFGTSAENAGVIGTSYEQAGVLGYSNNNIGVYGETANSASYAGFFKGNVKVNGTLTETVKHAVVPFPDGTQRLLHCMESPGHWFEDFGSARLKSGRAIVNLGADFAKVIKRGDYRVFVTPEGDCRGLYLRRKSATSFEVRELTGGKSSVVFSYRIVGRRKDIRGHRRFAKIDMRVPLTAPANSRKAAARAAKIRAVFLRKETRQHRPKGAAKSAPKGGRSRVLPKGPRPSIRPQSAALAREK